MSRRVIIIFIVFFIPIPVAFSQSVVISQIDNMNLLPLQEINVYISVTDAMGNPISDLQKDNFVVYEAVPDADIKKEENKREIIDFKASVNIAEGTNFMFIVDNSGSMYSTGAENYWRITYAKNAIKALLDEIDNPAHTVAFVSFNTSMGTIVTPTTDKVNIERALTKVERPTDAEAYTELYESLYHSLEIFKGVRGRKVIILLSDGEDFAKRDNPNFPERHGLDGAIELAQREGISVYTIGLAEGASVVSLSRIANETGGMFFPEWDTNNLAAVYDKIHTRVINEYRLTYKAGMEPAEKKNVLVECPFMGIPAYRSYYSATLFGLPWEDFSFLIFLLIPFALLLLWLLSRFKFEKKSPLPSLDVLTVGGKKKRIAPVTIMADRRTITIGGTSESDLTIVGDPNITYTEATINNKHGLFTIVSAGDPIKVNNTLVKTKNLRSGDLITIGNTTIVFDEGVKKTIIKKPTKVQKKPTQIQKKPTQIQKKPTQIQKKKPTIIQKKKKKK